MGIRKDHAGDRYPERARQYRPGKNAPAGEWNCMGHKRMFFAAERDLHLGTLRLRKPPVLPPAVREIPRTSPPFARGG